MEKIVPNYAARIVANHAEKSRFTNHGESRPESRPESRGESQAESRLGCLARFGALHPARAARNSSAQNKPF